jgi:hypothetical protein
VLAHAEIVVGAPDRDLADAVITVMEGAREVPGAPFEIRKDPVAALRVEAVELATEERFIVHDRLQKDGMA